MAGGSREGAVCVGKWEGTTCSRGPWNAVATVEGKLLVTRVCSHVMLDNEYVQILGFRVGLRSLLRPRRTCDGSLLPGWAALILGVCRQNVY